MRGGLTYLGVAYLAIWAGIAGYLGLLGRRQQAIERRLRELQSRSTAAPDQER
jgi:CcmD family protein